MLQHYLSLGHTMEEVKYQISDVNDTIFPQGEDTTENEGSHLCCEGHCHSILIWEWELTHTASESDRALDALSAMKAASELSSIRSKSTEEKKQQGTLPTKTLNSSN